MSDGSRGPSRRSVLASSLASSFAASFAAVVPLGGCSRRDPATYSGGWLGVSAERGHLMRDGASGSKSGALPDVAATRRVGALVVGAGVAGLGAARAMHRAGLDDCHVLELEDRAGGNSRGHTMAGMRCPLGAHYLPVPDESAVEVVALLEELGVRKTVNGKAAYDERMLCHSPQERLFIAGGWREGLLPPIEALPDAQRASTLEHYRRFAAAVASASEGGAFAMPTARSRWSDALTALDGITFSAWLDGQALTAPALRWYLDYCCRDDYGAGAAQVSAWAGLHYFASRHGFREPGDGGRSADTGEGVLTWPEGNAWLAERLAAPLGDRLHAGRIALAVREGRDLVEVDVLDAATRRRERWVASHVVLATPLFVSARLLESPPAALAAAAALAPHAPWVVANLQLAAALDDRPGAPPSWDNVVYGSTGLGYVDAMHQSTRPFAGPTVLTAYAALGGDRAGQSVANRERLLGDDWRPWAERFIADLSVVHPDLGAKIERVDLMRYGHAMSVPVPGARSSPALAALAAPQRRVHFAHSDLSSYSVFEEALFHGVRAARRIGSRIAI